MPYEETDRQHPLILELVYRLQEAGQRCSFSSKSLLKMGMDVAKIARHVENKQVDLWLPVSASREVLEWFALKDIPVFAIFGRRREIPIGSIGPDKAPAVGQVVRKLISFGHQRIVYLVRKERREPKPGLLEVRFLSELESAGINTGSYNLPDWEANMESLHSCLDRLLRYTPSHRNPHRRTPDFHRHHAASRAKRDCCPSGHIARLRRQRSGLRLVPTADLAR